MTMMSTTALPAREEDSFQIAVGPEAEASVGCAYQEEAGRILLFHLIRVLSPIGWRDL